METNEDAKKGRMLFFQVISDYLLFDLGPNASDEEIKDALAKIGERIGENILNNDVPFDEFRKYDEASQRIMAFRGIKKELTKEERLDWSDFFEGYKIFIEENPQYESLDLQKKLAYFDMVTIISPQKYKKRAIADAHSRAQNNGTWFAIFLLGGIPVLILMWSVHPVVGILGIAMYLWMAKNKFESNYYFR